MPEDGLAVVVTPNVNSLAARVMGRRWWHYRLAHICYFSRKTMIMALATAGLRIEKVESYSWKFSLGYLAERVTRYLPVGSVRLVSKTRIGKKLMDMQIPLNLGDSDIFYIGRMK
jgi:hypothetical protein